jgi:hypothetical protein
MSGLRMSNEIVTEQKPTPMLPKYAVPSNHVDVVGADTTRGPLDEKSIPRWNVVAEGGTPEVVIALRLEKWRSLEASGTKTGDLQEHIHNGLGGETRHGCAAKMFDAPDQSFGEEGAQVVGFLTEKFRPV